MRHCAVYKAGVVGYAEGLAIQDKARALVASGAWEGILVLLEHAPVITIGRSGGRGNLLVTPESLALEGVEVVDTVRGGNVTCHNPGQMIGYPVLDLSLWQEDVHWYVRMLEGTLIRTLARFGLEGVRRDRYTGVWLGQEKVAAIGVYVRDWVSSHGFALNVSNDLGLFERIVPCGIQGSGVTSLARQGCVTDVETVSEMLAEDFGQIFECTTSTIDRLDDGCQIGGEGIPRRLRQDARVHA
jgi:lipoyl(octanoyl) transferase